MEQNDDVDIKLVMDTHQSKKSFLINKLDN